MILLMPSALRHRVVLESPERASDDGGGATETWVAMSEFWADLKPVRGAEIFESGRVEGSVTHEVSLRWRPGVTPEMRFRKDSRVFQILAVIDVEERMRWLKCICEEREL